MKEFDEFEWADNQNDEKRKEDERGLDNGTN